MTHPLLLILVMAAVTMALRFLPFLLFEKHTPKVVLYLGGWMPGAVMAMLVISCFRTVSLSAAPYSLPELCAAALGVVLHNWRPNTLLPLLGGTAGYMLLPHWFP